jgi:hypothetical protein
MITVKVNINLEAEFKKREKLEKDRILKRLVSALAEATPVDTGEAQKGWEIQGDKIINKVEHIANLNEGTSKQAPSHFIEATLLAEPGVSPNGTIVRST